VWRTITGYQGEPCLKPPNGRYDPGPGTALGPLMNSFYEHHRDSIHWHYRCFDRILVNGLIQPFQQPERVVGFFNTYRAVAEPQLRLAKAKIKSGNLRFSDFFVMRR
jgi:hypothetical protein